MGTGADGRVVIDDLGALRTIADPLRHQLLLLLDRPRSVKELAHHLARPPDRLYYHLRLLEQHGFIRSSAGEGSRRVYEAAATSIEIDPALSVPASSVAGLVNGLLDQVRAGFAGSRRVETDGVKRSLLSLRQVWLDEEERAALTSLLATVHDDHHDGDDGPAGRRRYGVVTGIWPADDEDEHDDDGFGAG